MDARVLTGLHAIVPSGDARRRFGTAIALSVTVFALSVAAGFASTDPATAGSATDGTRHALGFAEIFLNNIVVLALVLLGAVTFGLTSAFFLFTTGTSLGASIRIALAVGLDETTILMLILPHGLVELSAFVVAGAIGFDSAWRTIAYLSGRTDVVVSDECLRSYGALVVLCVVAIVVAALLEAVVTMPFAASVAR